ncbi:tetraacyldisaccharide 4'-kinase [Mangrovimonas aestuarii]|uniref:tetraacyldisaccharide 4'-kinase n=1 Tax=Mangrovimonas aestuarii TaxID=3018443 RepID=UPI0023790F25|nr:tetraacyldisaccharide 4'-kinase [Mangrovimonas aestuarii]
MKLIRNIAFPLVPAYYSVTWLRNKLFDWGVKSSISYPFPVICVGNLSVGGTGKTPMIEYLIRLLKEEYKVATLSRGYKRDSEGFVLADKKASAKTIGDEPYQFYTKFGDSIKVAVDSNRQRGIQFLRNIDDKSEVILLDDAFQHRKVKAGFNILLTTYNKPYFKDIVLPTGDLREPRNGAKRADIIVITKCPDNLSDEEKSKIIEATYHESYQHVFFSSISYSNSVLSENESKTMFELSSFTLVTGIANATPLVNYLKGKGLDFEHLNYKDHHNFTDPEIEVLLTKEIIVTTEKDYMRLKQYEELKNKLYYLPIEVKIDRHEIFDELIRDFVKN